LMNATDNSLWIIMLIMVWSSSASFLQLRNLCSLWFLLIQAIRFQLRQVMPW
jgi:hypothetical protein